MLIQLLPSSTVAAGVKLKPTSVEVNTKVGIGKDAGHGLGEDRLHDRADEVAGAELPEVEELVRSRPPQP